MLVLEVKPPAAGASEALLRVHGRVLPGCCIPREALRCGCEDSKPHVQKDEVTEILTVSFIDFNKIFIGSIAWAWH